MVLWSTLFAPAAVTVSPRLVASAPLRAPPTSSHPPMAFAGRRSVASRLHPSIPHILTSHSHDEPPNPSLPPPLPPFHSPLTHPSRTLSFLPFSFHLAGPSHRSFSSSAPAPDAAPSGEVDAAAGVLADAAESATASVPAPFPGEVTAAAAGSFFPVAALQHLIDAVHTFTGLNWWAFIALTTVLIRSATIPLLMNQLRATVKLNVLGDASLGNIIFITMLILGVRFIFKLSY